MNIRHIGGILTAFSVTLLIGVLLIGTSSPALAGHGELALVKHEFAAHKAQLKYSYNAEREALNRAHRATLDQFKMERKHALRLCGSDKAAAMRDIHCRRRDAIHHHAHTVQELNAARRAGLKAMDAEYHAVRKSIRYAYDLPAVVIPSAEVVPVLPICPEPYPRPALILGPAS